MSKQDDMRYAYIARLEDQVADLTKQLFHHQEAISVAMQLDIENGVAWLNEEETIKFAKQYPTLTKALNAFLDMENNDEY